MLSTETPRHTLLQVPKPPLHPTLSTRMEFSDLLREEARDGEAHTDQTAEAAEAAETAEEGGPVSAMRATPLHAAEPMVVYAARAGSPVPYLPYLLAIVAFAMGFVLRGCMQQPSNRFRARNAAPASVAEHVTRTVDRMFNPR